MALADTEQYPAVRAMKVCLSCGGPKDYGLLVCWPCHNDLKLHHDGDYGPRMTTLLCRAQQSADEHRPEC